MYKTLSVAFLAAVALAGACACAAQSSDVATIINSGSTNASGYAIVVHAGGSSAFNLQNRAGAVESSPKPFSVSTDVATRFFADLKAARDGHAAGVPCMKSASFGTSTHITWDGWTSPDLDCPPGDPLMAALVKDEQAIRAASGIDTMHLMHGGGGPPMMRVESTTPASSPP
jgi:hypothetical protein